MHIKRMLKVGIIVKHLNDIFVNKYFKEKKHNLSL